MLRRTRQVSDVRPCPACLHESVRIVGAANGFAMVRCARCHTLFTAVLPATAEQAADYSNYYHQGNLQVPIFVERRLEKVVASFDRYRGEGGWLDVGCGAGALMRAAARHGWTPIGTEVAPGAAKAVRAQGLQVYLGALQELPLAPGSFDVVSLLEVIEHVPEPAALMADIARMVRPGGAVYMTTPHGYGVSARLLRAHWSVVGPPQHLQLFSTRGVVELLRRVGLRVCSLRAHAVNPHELMSALCRRKIASGERVETSYRLNESLSASRTGTLARSAVNGLLGMMRLGDSLKVTAERHH